MTKEEIKELRFELGSQNKDWIMKFFYNPIAKFVTLNQARYNAHLTKYRIVDLKKMPSKEDMLDRVFQLYGDAEIVKDYVASHNESDRTIIHKAVWEGGLDRGALEELFKKTILAYSGRGYWGKVEVISDLKSAWVEFITVVEPRGYHGDPDMIIKNADAFLSFPQPLRKLFSTHLPKPEGYSFAPIPQPEGNFKLHLTEDIIFGEFPRIIAYHGQGGVKYSQKGNPNQASAKKMLKTLKIVEFSTEHEYPTRSLLIAGMLGDSFKMKVITDTPDKIIRKLFEKDFQKNPVAPYMLTHLKGLNYFNWNDYRPDTTANIVRAFKELPIEQWISLENLESFVTGRFLPILPLKDWILRDKIQAEFTEDDQDGTSKWAIALHPGNIHEFVWKPYLAGHVCLFAAFGLMDIAIDPTIQNKYTPYENLHALRLTKLGSYVLGLSKEYTPPQRDNATSLTFEESSPIIRIEGDVVLGDTLLANYATRVSENRYQFSHAKFLKECKSTKDIKNKIALFKQTVGQKLPSFWESYLQELVDNSKSVALQTGVKVFTIPADNKALHRIIVQDEFLRKLVIKAEQFHILVAEINLTTFTNRMKELGYVIG
jgi:hypothetical protein